MFLQYAVWGVWLPVLATYLQSPSLEGGLGFTSGQVGWIIGVAASMGAIFAPFIAGQFADRYFPTEKFLALLLFFGGIVKIILSFRHLLRHGFLYQCYTVSYTCRLCR